MYRSADNARINLDLQRFHSDATDWYECHGRAATGAHVQNAKVERADQSLCSAQGSVSLLFKGFVDQLTARALNRVPKRG